MNKEEDYFVYLIGCSLKAMVGVFLYSDWIVIVRENKGVLSAKMIDRL